VHRDMLEEQITLSYSTYEDGEKNNISLKGINLAIDPTTFYNIHCDLFPEVTKKCDLFSKT
jgi:hypothetical protein